MANLLNKYGRVIEGTATLAELGYEDSDTIKVYFMTQGV
jgi:hypothetical protein